MDDKRFFLIDAMAMAFRNYHAFGARPLTTSKGLPVSSIFGSAMFLQKLIEDEKPQYLCIATDSKEPTFRHELYKAYKANRKEMPEDLAVQIPYLYRLFEVLGIHLLKQAGMEADDLIGSMVKKYAKKEVHAYIVSGDKDFMQLIDDHTFLYSPKKGEPPKIISYEGVREKFSCRPDQVIDVLALIGDSSDNVPGVPGIGEKSAQQLISEYGSLDSIYENIENIRNLKQKQKLVENKELAYLSKKLVSIHCDIALEHNLEEYAYDWNTSPDFPKLLELYRELDFRNLAEKISQRLNQSHPLSTNIQSHEPLVLEAQVSISSQKEPPIKLQEKRALLDQRLENPPGQYQSILNIHDMKRMVAEIKSEKLFSFDTETTGLSPVEDKPIGISFGLANKKAFYLPLHVNHNPELRDLELFMEEIKSIFEDTELMAIAHNAKFDLQMLANLGVFVKCKLVDTMIAAYLCDSIARDYSLDAQCLKELNFEKIPTEVLIPKNSGKSMLDAPLKEISLYACEDADFCFRLWEKLFKKIESLNLQNVFWNIEMPLVQILADMEQAGIYVDAEALSEISNNLDQLTKTYTESIYQLAGEEFNINSPKQLGTILFEKMKVHEQLGILKIKKTKSGYSTDVSVLERLSEHPIAQMILEYRTCTKLKNTYVDILPQLISPKSGRVHTHFLQTGTSTGRLSSNEPNLQNIPIRSDIGKQIRKAFAAPDQDTFIVSADYSQIELRLLAHIADESGLKQAFEEGLDIHRATASKMFGVEVSEVNSDQRSQAKAINFGIIYGMGAQRLARETGVSMSEAKNFIERYFSTYPRIKTYMDHALNFAKAHGYTETIFGRRRPIPEIFSKDPLVLANAKNIAINSPIQGTAADLVKIAMIRVNEALEKNNFHARMLLQVHDELVFECKKDEAEGFKSCVKKAMENACQLSVPLIVEIQAAKNWYEAH